MRADTYTVPGSPELERPMSGGLESARDFGENTISIHNSVIAVIAKTAAAQVPGVHDLAGSLVDDLAGMVGRRSAERGVHVRVEDNRVTVDVHLVVEYGAYIPTVALQVQKEVREAIERMTGKAIRAVNILVQGVQGPREGGKGVAP